MTQPLTTAMRQDMFGEYYTAPVMQPKVRYFTGQGVGAEAMTLRSS